MRSIIILFILLLFTACAKKPAEEVADAIDIAKDYLTDERCDEAIELLEGVGHQSGNSVYLMTLASAYSCRAGFNALDFLTYDIDLISNADPADFMQTMVSLSLAAETTTDSDQYTDMKRALAILLESDGAAQPGHAARVAAYGPRKAGEMGVQVLLLSMVQLGKFLNHFGDVNAAGKKGGNGNNTCFMNYNYASAQTAVANLPAGNACVSNTGGHADLDITTDDGKRRLCEGLMLFTNVLDVLTNIDLSGNDTMAPLMDVAAVIAGLKETAVTLDASLATLLDMTSQSLCQETLAAASERDNMELIFASLFEAGLP